MIEIKEFMPHNYPMSRDHGYPSFPCKQLKCMANKSGKCISPSLCHIGEDGRCEGYTPKEGIENKKE